MHYRFGHREWRKLCQLQHHICAKNTRNNKVVNCDVEGLAVLGISLKKHACKHENHAEEEAARERLREDDEGENNSQKLSERRDHNRNQSTPPLNESHHKVFSDTAREGKQHHVDVKNGIVPAEYEGGPSLACEQERNGEVTYSPELGPENHLRGGRVVLFHHLLLRVADHRVSCECSRHQHETNDEVRGVAFRGNERDGRLGAEGADNDAKGKKKDGGIFQARIGLLE